MNSVSTRLVADSQAAVRAAAAPAAPCDAVRAAVAVPTAPAAVRIAVSSKVGTA